MVTFVMILKLYNIITHVKFVALCYFQVCMWLCVCMRMFVLCSFMCMCGFHTTCDVHVHIVHVLFVCKIAYS